MSTADVMLFLLVLCVVIFGGGFFYLLLSFEKRLRQQTVQVQKDMNQSLTEMRLELRYHREMFQQAQGSILLLFCLMFGSPQSLLAAAPAGPGDEPSGVTIQQETQRMKATIPSEGETEPRRKPNILYQGVEKSLQGIYYLAKFSVDGIGKATDVTIVTVQSFTRKIYDFASQPFHRKGNEQAKKV